MKKKIDALIKMGEYSQAFDLSQEACMASCDDAGLKDFLHHRAVICLLRSGALEQAKSEYFRNKLHRITEDEDILALGGKIFKDFSHYCQGSKRLKYRQMAREKYGEAYEQSGGYFSGINYATLSLLVDEHKTAQKTAQDILDALQATSESDYYTNASRAEAFLILADIKNAAKAFSSAIAKDPDNYSAHATTLKQFSLILDHQAEDKTWLDQFRPAKTVQFCGHLLLGKDPKDEQIKRLQEELAQVIKQENIGFAYGALAAGSDIIIAEQLLAAGCELHVILPVDEDIFIRNSVAPYGRKWIKRYQYCRDKAQSIHVVFDNLDYLDFLSISQADQTAMGMAVLKARTLETSAKQVVVCDPERSNDQSITAKSQQYWKENISGEQIILEFPSLINSKDNEAKNNPALDFNRRLMATVFVDMHGYTKLKESQIKTFIAHILTPLATCCEHFSPAPDFINTWGDGLFLAFEKAGDAAKLTLVLQKKFRSIDLEGLNLPDHLSLRIGGHYGIVYESEDPFLKRQNIFGSDVSLAARIEPITPPGSIYVSSNFACQLALSNSDEFRCEYIGQMALHKNRHKIPLFSLQPYAV